MKRQDYRETERTILRNLTIDDAEDFYALNLEPKEKINKIDGLS